MSIRGFPPLTLALRTAAGSAQAWRAETARRVSLPSAHLREHIRLGEEAPHVDHRLAGEIEITISRVRRAQDQDVAARDQLVESRELRICGHERVGAQYPAGEIGERLLELVAQRGAGIVDVGLERHA